MGIGAPLDNKFAETWTEEVSTKLFNDALKLAENKTEYVIGDRVVNGYEFHNIQEISAEMEYYPDLFKYLRKKFASCDFLMSKLKNKLERNSFSDSKKGIIKEATAIFNLKVNYGWIDKQQIEQHQTNIDLSNLSTEEIKALLKDE